MEIVSVKGSQNGLGWEGPESPSSATPGPLPVSQAPCPAQPGTLRGRGRPSHGQGSMQGFLSSPEPPGMRWDCSCRSRCTAEGSERAPLINYRVLMSPARAAQRPPALEAAQGIETH